MFIIHELPLRNKGDWRAPEVGGVTYEDSE